MTRVAATLPGYANVARAGEVLHLAPRSVRDLIYAGRLPSVRVGRLHYIKATDLEHERRRRLGLPLPRRGNRSSMPRSASREGRVPRTHATADAALRRLRAAERFELVARWSQRHHFVEPRVPATVVDVTSPTACEACGRVVKSGRMVELSASRLCVICGRRALLDWADQRRLESQAARRVAHSLGEPRAEPGAVQAA